MASFTLSRLGLASRQRRATRTPTFLTGLRQVGVPRGEFEGEGDAKWIELASEETGEVVGAACVRVFSRKAVVSLMRDVTGRRSISSRGGGAFPDVRGGGGVDDVVRDLSGASVGRGEYVSEPWGKGARVGGKQQVERSSNGDDGGGGDGGGKGGGGEWGADAGDEEDDYLYEEGSDDERGGDGGSGESGGFLERGWAASEAGVKQRGGRGGAPDVDLSILSSLNDGLFLGDG